MTFLDENTEKIQESEYIKACNLIKSIHGIVVKMEPVVTEEQKWAMRQILRLEDMKWVFMTEQHKTEALLVELDILQESSCYETKELKELEILVLNQYDDLNIQSSHEEFLQEIYESYRRFQNMNIEKRIMHLKTTYSV